MNTAEQESLGRAHLLWLKRLIGVVVAAIVIGLALTFAVLARPGTVEHVLGMSTEQSATETAIDEVTFCTRTNRDVYTLEGDEGGQHRSEQIGRCGDPWAVGDHVEIWSTSGVTQTSSPTTLRLTGAALALGVATAFALPLQAWYRVRRSTRSVLHGTWRPETVRTLGRPGRGRGPTHRHSCATVLATGAGPSTPPRVTTPPPGCPAPSSSTRSVVDDHEDCPSTRPTAVESGAGTAEDRFVSPPGR